MTMISIEDRHDIQGIVTTGFGHLHEGAFLFVTLPDRAGGARWLGELLDDVTTAAPWGTHATGKDRPDVTLNVALTYPGLELLGLPDEALAGMPTEFVVGMALRAQILGDTGPSAPEHWELGGPDTAVLHAVLILYGKDRAILDKRVAALRAIGDRHGIEVAAVERGTRSKRSREPFGFANDGISQPRIEGVRKEDIPGPWVMRTGEFLLGHLNEQGFYPPSPAVAAAHDPRGLLRRFPKERLPECRDFGRNGSFLVYRKLYQDVAGFWRFIQECRDGDQAAMAHLAAKLMGRWPSGAPLVLSPDEDDPKLAKANEFTYRPTDADGYSCPLGAHIRRANPRDALARVNDSPAEAIESANLHRILRRGIPFGEPLVEEHDLEPGRAPIDLEDKGGPRGLHFVVINADTKRQFEFVQQSWLNNPTFARLFADKDAIVGDNEPPGRMTLQQRPLRATVTNIPRFVAVRGGGYFFLPGMSAMRFLATGAS